MMSATHTPERSLASRLQELVETRFGHMLPGRMSEALAEKMQQVLDRSGFVTLDEYFALLRTLPLDAHLVQTLIQAITNNESYFFRDATSVQSLREHVLPPLISRAQGSRTLRVWSAGCSTGEELYTVSILLREMIPDIDFWEIALVGTDIDEAALTKARQATYKNWSLRTTDEQDRERYFEVLGRGVYQLRKRYQRGAVFSLHNLADPEQAPPAPGHFDLILCRNVSIYMNKPAVAALARKMLRSLSAGGSWVAGPSDPVPPAGFSTRVLPGLIEHHVRAEESALRSSASPASSNVSISLAEQPKFPSKLTTTPPASPGSLAAQPLPWAATTLNVLKPTQPAGRSNSAMPRPKPHSAPAPSKPANTGESAFARALDSALDGALEAARDAANRGELESADRLLHEILHRDPINVEAYLLRAMLMETSGKLEQAEADLRRVIYLEPFRGEAHLRLGLLLVRNRRNEAAIRAFRNALMMDAEGTADASLRDAAAMHLLRLLREEIQ